MLGNQASDLRGLPGQGGREPPEWVAGPASPSLALCLLRQPYRWAALAVGSHPLAHKFICR